MMQARSRYVSLVWAFALLAAGGCGRESIKAPPSDIAATIERLTCDLSNTDKSYYAGIEIAKLGLAWRIPPRTVEALRKACEDHRLSFHDTDYFYIGGGRTWFEAGDGARIAFLMWQVRDVADEAKRLELLWRTYCEPREGDAIPDFCLDQLVAHKGEAVMPYLFAAAAMGNWYQARSAALRLGDYWPASEPMLLLLAKSDMKDVAEIARRNLVRKGKPLPLDADVGDLSIGIPTWTRGLSSLK